MGNVDMRIKWILRLTIFAFLGLVAASNSHAQIIADFVDSFTELGEASVVVAGKQANLTSASAEIKQVFTGVAVEIGTLDTEAKGFFRFLVDGTWTDWKPAHINRSATGGTIIAGYRQNEPIGASQFEFRADVSSETLTVVRNAGVFNNAFDEDSRPAPALSPLVGAKTGNIIPPRLITRAQWNAKPFVLGNPVPLANGPYEYMTMHHAAGYSAETEAQGKAQMLAMQDLHQNVRGWSDIGYQFAIDRGGRLYQGRPFMDNSTSLSQVPVLARGAHVGEQNTGNIGVVIMGCYHPPEGSNCLQQITPAAYETYKVLFAFLSERYGVAPTLIRGHRDFSSTSCPGDNNYVLLPQLRVQVANLLEVGNEPLGDAEMTASVGSNGDVELNWNLSQDFGIDSLYVERINSLGSSRLVPNAFESGSFSDVAQTGETSVTYLLVASGADGRKQELARIELQIEDPSTYLLTSAFPNPASTSAQFRYFLTVEGIVRLSLIDAIGREVESWDTGFQTEDEWYTQTVDVSRLTPGMYFFRIEVSGFSGTAFDKAQPLIISR
jgi:hypothetical protein